jgi:hypothetical protein
MSTVPESCAGATLELAALDDLILGRGVKRGRHEVPESLWRTFRQRLLDLGFQPSTVGAIDIEVGVRVPAWLFRPPVADFGTVFWEVFTPRAKRRLFGSEVRNPKGDWEIQLYPTSQEVLNANLALAETYDASRPIGIY